MWSNIAPRGFSGGGHAAAKRAVFCFNLTRMQVCGFVLAASGSIVLAYYLGLIAGRETGFKDALYVREAGSPKIVVPEKYREKGIKPSSDIFARLSDPGKENIAGGRLPKVSRIRSADSYPVEKGKEDKKAKRVGENLVKKKNAVKNGEAGDQKLKTQVVEAKNPRVHPVNPPPKVLANSAELDGAQESTILQRRSKREGTSMLKGVLPKGWFAQVAAPRQIKDAEELGKRLKSSGFAVVIERAYVRGEEYFRVLVGPEETRTQAAELVKQLARESYLRGRPFIKKVG